VSELCRHEEAGDCPACDAEQRQYDRMRGMTTEPTEAETRAEYMHIAEGTPVHTTVDYGERHIIVDYASDGSVVGIELLTLAPAADPDPDPEMVVGLTGLCGLCGRIGATIYRSTDGLWVCERHIAFITADADTVTISRELYDHLLDVCQEAVYDGTLISLQDAALRAAAPASDGVTVSRKVLRVLIDAAEPKGMVTTGPQTQRIRLAIQTAQSALRSSAPATTERE
jgi:uncharacterized protein YuzE